MKPKQIFISILPLVLAAFALSPTARAQLSPPPDGGYAGNNTAEGTDALFSLTTGTENTALGFNALFSNTTGDSNTATGSKALLSNTTGIRNTANGFAALESNTTGNNNTATGRAALPNNTTGSDNTADGHDALFSNSTGIQNTATGSFALLFNTTGNNNTANGPFALLSNTTGNGNIAVGGAALLNNTTGGGNTATGLEALRNNTIGVDNTANGFDALLNNTTGAGNIALGNLAGSNLTIGDNNIDIGNQGVAGEANTIRIGTQGTQTATYIAGISGTAIGAGIAVRVNANGQLGTVGSSARFKQNIKPMDKASEVIHALKPVTFQYKQELDREGISQFGLVAEEVEKVSPDLVARDDQGNVYTVRYEAVNAMLLNEFLKEHRKVQEQQATIAQLKKDFGAAIAQLTARLDEQAAQIQKVSAQLEVNKTVPQIVLNNQ
jgi:trimeric autotransporter adhesin